MPVLGVVCLREHERGEATRDCTCEVNGIWEVIYITREQGPLKRPLLSFHMLMLCYVNQIRELINSCEC